MAYHGSTGASDSGRGCLAGCPRHCRDERLRAHVRAGGMEQTCS